MANHKITVRYDGSSFFGWQRHKDNPTIQGEIERVLSERFDVPVAIHGSGRTDRGAHAEGQVFSVSLPQALDLESDISELNRQLPDAIQFVNVEHVADDFHARTHATGKIYRYEILNEQICPAEHQGRVWHVPGKLDVGAMIEAVKGLTGEHDFSSFATRPNFKQQSTTRHLQRIDITQDDATITITMEANSFLYKMVRNLVRAIVKVGEGRYQPTKLIEILNAHNRNASPGTAPASGLYLDSVKYAD